MNADTNIDMIAPKWLWLGLAIGVVMLIGSIWWASSGGSAQGAKIDVEEEPATGAGPVMETPYAYVPPTEPTDQWTGGGSPGGSVSISPARPTRPARPEPPELQIAPERPAPPTPQPVTDKPARPVAKKRQPGVDESIRDMFPVGPIVRASPKREVHREEPVPAKVSESFPEFNYGGTNWSFTGSYADASKLDVTPTGLELAGRAVFVLANSTGPTSVIFVQSTEHQGMYAIYRQ